MPKVVAPTLLPIKSYKSLYYSPFMVAEAGFFAEISLPK
jgi:hypothetical protein